MSGLGLYVHWPYCAQKCPYCDFNSHVRTSIDETRWAAAILRELDAIKARTDYQKVESIFFGGGTPSLMSGRALSTVLDGIAARWLLPDNTEITLEANPNSVEQSRFRDYRAAGVNRVSVGVQALDPVALKNLGRLHGVAEAETAIRLAREIFPRMSFDLIYARPDQTLDAWRDELARALAFGSDHLSVYQLTIEPGTAYATLARQGKLVLPAEDDAAALFEATDEMCRAAGLLGYEVSNYARPGQESRHNLIYWRYGDYAGVGPGAHGRVTIDGKRVATQAERLPERWLARIDAEGHSLSLQDIDSDEAAREHLLMTLRLSEGLALDDYEKRWGVRLSSAVMQNLAALGLLTIADNRLAATPRGRLVLNTLIAELAA